MVQGLASYLVGMMYFTDFEHEVEGSYARAAAHFTLAVEHGEPADVDDARVWLVYCYERIGRWVDAQQVAGTIEREGKARKDKRRQALGLYMLARHAHSTGALDGALGYARKAVQLLDKLGDIRSRAVTMGQIADIYYLRGDLDEALRIRIDEQLPVYDKLGDIHSRAVTMGQIADIYYDRGELGEALRIRIDEELPVYKQLGAEHDTLVCKANAAFILLERNGPGDREEAKALLEQALATATQMQVPEAATIADIIKQNNL